MGIPTPNHKIHTQQIWEQPHTRLHHQQRYKWLISNQTKEFRATYLKFQIRFYQFSQTLISFPHSNQFRDFRRTLKIAIATKIQLSHQGACGNRVQIPGNTSINSRGMIRAVKVSELGDWNKKKKKVSGMENRFRLGKGHWWISLWVLHTARTFSSSSLIHRSIETVQILSLVIKRLAIDDQDGEYATCTLISQ